MRRVLLVLAALSSPTVAARAAEQPVYAPPPAWVKPAPFPTDNAAPTEAAIRFILSDRQIALEPGREVSYAETAFRIQTPQGLAAGNISLPWRPETSTLTIHKLVVHRGEQVIDILASGQKFTVLRREQNLERATLDGVLTANILPEGLQVGDVVDMAVSVETSDPVLKGHVEFVVNQWNAQPVDHAHLRVQWPDGLPLKLRKAGPLPELATAGVDGHRQMELTLDNVQPVLPPKGAPPRYAIGRVVEASDFAGWADLAALMEPLYAKAATLPAEGALRAELETIKSTARDPKARAEAALALVQSRVRYVALAMGTGGLVPADAESTWSRRFGDCKGKTALLLALLHGLDIAAEPVLVSVAHGDGLDSRLPLAGLFDHVIVRATIAGKTYWMDGTQLGDTDLDRLSVPAWRWGLPVLAKGAALVPLTPTPLDRPASQVSLTIDATAGLTAPAPAKFEETDRGPVAAVSNAVLTSLTPEQRDSKLRETIRKRYDYIDIQSIAETFDAAKGEMHVTMEGTAHLKWTGQQYRIDTLALGSRADLTRDPTMDQDAPWGVAHPIYSEVVETIRLPKGLGKLEFGPGMEIDETVGGVHYARHASLADEAVTVTAAQRSLASEFPAKEAAAVQASLRAMADHPAILVKPAAARATDDDLTAARTETPTTANGYVDRGNMLYSRNQLNEAEENYGKAIELEPDNLIALANRALVRARLRELDGAKTDLAKARSIDAAATAVLTASAALAQAERRPRDAIADYTELLKREPGQTSTLLSRAMTYASLRDVDHAIEDYSAAIAVHPDDARLVAQRAEFFMGQRRYDDAIRDFDRVHELEPKNDRALANRGFVKALKGDAEGATRDADAALAINPKDPIAFSVRGLVAIGNGKPKEAVAADTTALELAPNTDTSFVLARRAEAYREMGNDDQALADAGAAIAKNRGVLEMYSLRATILRQRGKPDEAAAEAFAVATANPDNPQAHVTAGKIYAALHKQPEAMAAFDKAVALQPNVATYIERSQHRPKSDLAARQADLDAAFKLDPKSGRAFLAQAQLLREKGDTAGAIAAGSKALETAPLDPSLLVDRGISYAKAGDAKHAEADFALARAKAPRPTTLNNLCWRKATEGVALKSALADCDLALSKNADDPATLDSRGFTLLRLERWDDALATYGKALGTRPDMPTALFGSAIALTRKGDKEKANADLAEALKRDPEVRTQFAEYGVTL